MGEGRKDLRGLEGLELANRIYEIGTLVHKEGSLDDVIKAIVQRVLEETDSDYVGIGLVDEAGEQVVHAWGVMRDGTWIQGQHSQAVGVGVTGTVVETGKPLYLEDVSTFESYYPLVEGIASEMAVPLKVGESIIGTLDIESRSQGKFSKTEMALLQLIATPVALAIHNSRLFQEERHRLRQLTLLNRVGSTITSTVELEELIQRIVDDLRQELGYEFVAMGLVDPDGKRLRLSAISTDMDVDLKVGHSQEPGEGVAGMVVSMGESVLIHDVSRFHNYVPTAKEVASEMCVPIKTGERVIGMLDAESRQTHAFDDSDLLVFETVADTIAQAVENARSLDLAERMREDLARMVIHDMRNPLTVVQTTLEYLEHSLETLAKNGHVTTSTGRNRRYIESAKASCEQLTVMINGLLELQRIEAGEMELELEPTKVSELVAGIVDSTAIVASAMQVDLLAKVESTTLEARIDRRLITRVLENLLANAMKYTPEGGSVMVEAGPVPVRVLEARLPNTASGILFSVRDTGRGIDPEDHERIFEKFAVVEVKADDRKRGVGLGLAFCRQAVLAHGGDIWVESAPGKGSAFSFVLPTGHGPTD